MKRVMIFLTILVLVFALIGCVGMSSTQQGALSGAAIGAGGGALFSTIIGGNTLGGAALGAGIGALGGYLVGESDERYRPRHRSY
jgi:osmotically inducible lipoprotein OsmB